MIDCCEPDESGKKMASDAWYHGSDRVFSVLREGSTITQWRELAEAFSHQPTVLSYDDHGKIEHNGTKKGYLYVIDEPVQIGVDVYQHPRTTMDPGLEFLTKRPLAVRLIKELDPRLGGEVMSVNTEPIVVEHTYEVPASLVWEAITNVEKMRRWFFEELTDFRPEVGFETEFSHHHEGVDYVHLWKVTEVVPERKITYKWRYGGYPGDSSVTWEIYEVPEGTRLRLIHRGQETFPKDNPAFTRESCQAGWEYFLHEGLAEFFRRPDR